jgi:hypothetical protein
MFATWISASLSRSLASADPDLSGGNSKAGGAEQSRAHDPTRLPKLEDTLKRYEDHFNRHLRILMDRYVMHSDMLLFSLNTTLLIPGSRQFELFRCHGKCRLVEAGACFGNGDQGRDLKRPTSTTLDGYGLYDACRDVIAALKLLSGPEQSRLVSLRLPCFSPILYRR